MRVTNLVLVFLLGIVASIVHTENVNNAAKQRHVIYDEAWWFVG